MRKISMIVAALLLGIIATSAACVSSPTDDRIIKFEQLPQTAQQFIKDNFAGETISHIIYDSDLTDRDYKVKFESGREVEFASDGKWTSVDCRREAVPAAIVPAKIAKYVEKNFAGKSIVEIKREWREWEVKLSNGLDLEFNDNFKLRKIDD